MMKTSGIQENFILEGKTSFFNSPNMDRKLEDSSVGYFVTKCSVFTPW
jgi:hypothetical protein